LDIDALRDRTIGDLADAGIITSRECAEVVSVQVLQYGYPIISPDTERRISHIRSFYERRSIYCVGRFGGWRYASVQDCWGEGVSVANRLLRRPPSQ